MSEVSFKQWADSALSRIVAYFHSRGYVFDFVFSGADCIVCLQDNVSFQVENVVIKEIYRNYDLLSHACKLMYAVDTCCGYYGLIMKDANCKRDSNDFSNLSNVPQRITNRFEDLLDN